MHSDIRFFPDIPIFFKSCVVILYYLSQYGSALLHFSFLVFFPFVIRLYNVFSIFPLISEYYFAELQLSISEQNV